MRKMMVVLGVVAMEMMATAVGLPAQTYKSLYRFDGENEMCIRDRNMAPPAEALAP